MNKPSVHLSWGELACKNGIPYPQKYITDGTVFKLAEVFEEIRATCGDYPIIVNSAYRTPEYNKKIGGARNSQHVLGRALDLKHTQLSNEQFFTTIRENAVYLGVRGLGHYNNFVHVDIRYSPHLIVWYSTLLKDSIT